MKKYTLFEGNILKISGKDISPAEYTWKQLNGFYINGIYNRIWCMNCKSEIILEYFHNIPAKPHCPNDECYNFSEFKLDEYLKENKDV